MHKTALVLAGGGARGSYELGVWQALREMKVEIDLVTGTSIGAINGAFITQGDYDTAVALWDSIETSRVIDVPIDEKEPLKKKVWQTYQNFVIHFIKSGGTDTTPLKETLQTFIDEKKVRASRIGYGLVTLEKDANIPHELWIGDIPEGKMIDYIIASASIYPAFRPHTIDNVQYVDGAYHDNLPVTMAVEQGAAEIIAVDLEAFGVVKQESLELARRVVYIRSHWPLGPTLVFDKNTIRRNIRLGYLDTLKAYGVYEGNAYAFLPGFCAHITGLLSKCLPLKGLLEKSGGGSLDQLFIAGVQKVFEKRGVAELDERSTAMVCAELAGEIFGMDSETVYSFAAWQERLREQVSKTQMPDALSLGRGAEMGTELIDYLCDSVKTRISKQSRTKLAGTMIAGLLKTDEYKRPAASVAVMPETFLAGVYLAATRLVQYGGEYPQ